MNCDHVFAWHAVIPPSHCPKCGRCLGCGQGLSPPAPYRPYPTTPYPSPYPWRQYPTTITYGQNAAGVYS